MKQIKVIIGANYGDEGKGLFTSYYANKNSNGIVIRFNGGAQAGHTAFSNYGEKHVFSHFCSGTFAKLPSYLSKFFIVNPMIFKKEYLELVNKKISPKIFIDSRCLITTPYDVLINQIIEINRCKSRHGSCGLGINETIERNNNNDYKLTLNDLEDINRVRIKLNKIKNEYLIERLDNMGIQKITNPFDNYIKNENIIENYISDLEFIIKNSKIIDYNILDNYEELIFEGAQGLSLDQNHKNFPHVTRSNTGIKNVMDIAKEYNLMEDNFEIVYVTRSYLTKHGAGFFQRELSEKPYHLIIDDTNIPNDFQGSLRFSLLDIDQLKYNIYKDIKNIKVQNYNIKLAITCLDHLENDVQYYFEGKSLTSSVESFIRNTFNYLQISSGFLSYGRTLNTIKKYEYRFYGRLNNYVEKSI